MLDHGVFFYQKVFISVCISLFIVMPLGSGEDIDLYWRVGCFSECDGALPACHGVHVWVVSLYMYFYIIIFVKVVIIAPFCISSVLPFMLCMK